ncbi:MAG: FAD-dependent oxidoreductase [bacterium]|nr:MAG: FAD-dependent oxidoreductase [bacterium]
MVPDGRSTGPETGSGLRIGVIGGGVAGIVAAYLLQRDHEVTLFEANDYLGGHTRTIVLQEGPDAGTPVDTGFIVLNDRTYPLFTTFLGRLEVPTRPTEMSFSFHDRVSGLAYSGSGLSGLFTQRRNLFSPPFMRMLLGIRRFFRDAKRDLVRDAVPDTSLGDYLKGRYPRETIDHYIIPMASAIWSTSSDDIDRFPAGHFLRFFENHGLLGVRHRPQWMTVVGGSHSYVKAFRASFGGRIRLGAPVKGIRREEESVSVRTAWGEVHRFDRVVVATHADDALDLLEDPSEDETRLLGPWRYQVNRTVLHTDTSVLPPERRAWSCWNYCREDAEGDQRPVSVSYSMNLLQGLDTVHHYCVSLNRRTPIREGSAIAGMVYRHPGYTFASMNTQRELPLLNGVRHTYYCGSYFGYGFHEDAVRSAVEVGRAFGVTL